MFSQELCHNIHQIAKHQRDFDVQDSCCESKLKRRNKCDLCNIHIAMKVCRFVHTTTAPIRENSWGLTNSHKMCHLNSGAGFLVAASRETLLFTSASQYATRENSRADTVSTDGPRINFRAAPGCLDVWLGWRPAFWARHQKRLTAFPGCGEELDVDVFHLYKEILGIIKDR